jgi:hypothetical protein
MKRIQNRFLTQEIQALTAQEVEPLVPNFAELQKDAYEFVQAVPYPAKGTGGVYTERYFESLIPLLKKKPFPGSAEMLNGGHQSTSADFYTTGLRLEKNGESKGVAYFRITVPPTDMQDRSNAGLIRAIKNKAVEFSLTVDVDEERENGQIVYNAEKGFPHNDAVDEGAMEQALYANALKEAELIALIQEDKICETPGGALVENGKLNRLAAVALQSDAENSAFAGRLLNAIAARRKNKETRSKTMTKQEILDAAKTAVTNNDLTLEEVAAYIGKENKLKNADEAEKLKILETIRGALGLESGAKAEAVKAAVEELLTTAEGTAEVVAETEANKLIQSSIKNRDEEMEKAMVDYVKNQLAPHGKKILNKKYRAEVLEKFKDDKVLNYMRGKQAETSERTGGGQAQIKGI